MATEASTACPPTARDYWIATDIFDSQTDSRIEVKPRLIDVQLLDTDLATKLGCTHLVTLDRTIFHPQGGGQPSDVGKLFITWVNVAEEEREVVLDVKFVRTRDDNRDVIEHLGVFEGAAPELPDSGVLGERVVPVRCVLDADKRLLHARLHSAGHLIDVAMKQSGFGDLVPTKGCHLVGNAFVEYSGLIPAGPERNSAAQKLQVACDKIIEADAEVEARIVPYEEIGALCGGSTPAYMPPGKEARVVRFKLADDSTTDGFAPGCPCGGTHVARVAQIGSKGADPSASTGLKIKKITCKKGVTRVSYDLS